MSISQERQITTDDINAMARSLNAPHKVETASSDATLMKGQFRFFSLAAGCTMHCCDVEELQSASSTSQLAPCISFNLLLKGKVHFALGAQHHQLDASNHALCSAITLNKPELLTRFTQTGTFVRKINIMVSKAWLAEREGTGQNDESLTYFLAEHAHVKKWLVPPAMIQLGEKILHASQKQSVTDHLKLEQYLLKLLQLLITQIQTRPSDINQQYIPTPSSLNYATNENLKTKVEKSICQEANLASIAKAMGMSISTLQRKFRAAHGISVMDFVRQHRLNLARQAIVIDRKSIGEAAFMSGYNHPSNFISAFKKQFKTTPNALLKNTR